MTPSTKWMIPVFVFGLCGLALSACDQEVEDLDNPRAQVGDEVPDQQLFGEPGYAENAEDENYCVPASDANAKVDAGCTFEGGKTAEQAKAQIAACLEQADCFTKEGGFVPKEGTKDAHWDRCFEALCECNEDVLATCGGKEVTELECELSRISAGGKAEDCDAAPGNIAVFKGAKGLHALSITEAKLEEDQEEGEEQDVLLTFRDPNNDPAFTDQLAVDASGEVVESLSTSVPEGATLLGCWGFTPKTQ